MAIADEPVSGIYSCIQLENGVELFENTGWQYLYAAEDTGYRSCQTKGQNSRIDGGTDLTGSFNLVYRSDQSFMTLAEMQLNALAVLWLFKRIPSTGLAGVYDEIPVKILSWDGGASVADGGPQNWTVSFGLKVTQANPAPLFDQPAPALP